MKPNNLVGTILRVVEADDFRILLEHDDASGSYTNKFVLIEAESIEGIKPGILRASDLRKS